MTQRKRKSTKGTYRRLDKDPILDLIQTEAQRVYGDRLGQAAFEALAHATKGAVTAGTLRNWVFGGTRRPQSFTTRRVLEALGIKVQYVREDGTVVRKNWI